jgi:nucleotide-binding universal stress UspA family protein
MFKRILLPTDGSPSAYEALNCAVAVARKFESELHVIYVVEPPAMLTAPYSESVMMDVLQAGHEAGERAVAEATETIRKSGLSRVQSSMLEGQPAEQIVAYARDHEIDLIVMGTHGRRGINRLLLGSIAEEVVRTASIPVMTVRMSPN